MAHFHRYRNYHYTNSSSDSKKKSHITSKYDERYHYVSPLEKLDQITERYIPNKVYENNELEKLYQNGICTKFEPSTFKYFHINHETPMDVLDDLMDYASYIKHFTIDTENQMNRPRQPSEPALIQIEFIHENDPPMIILIETMHLPPEDSSKFHKIKKLCKMIFSRHNVVNAWGAPKAELKKFTRFNLFNNNDLDQLTSKNIEDEFRKWYNKNYSESKHRKKNPNETYSLQSAIYLTYNKWLDKRMTLANSGHGIDLSLRTYLPIKNHHERKTRIIGDEEEYRQLMTVYAINDCLAVTKLAQRIIPIERQTPSDIIYQEEVHAYEQKDKSSNLYSINDTSYELEIHPQNEFLEPNDVQGEDQLLYDESMEFHVQNVPIELTSDDNVDNHSLPEIMKLHLPFPSKYSYEGKNDLEVHMKNYPSITTNCHEQQVAVNDEYQKKSLTKTQKENWKRRMKRYDFPVVRHIYERFSVGNVKQILIDINIRWTNVLLVKHKLLIGLDNAQVQRQVEGLLHEQMFTKEHYLRIRRRHQRHRTNNNRNATAQ